MKFRSFVSEEEPFYQMLCFPLCYTFDKRYKKRKSGVVLLKKKNKSQQIFIKFVFILFSLTKDPSCYFHFSFKSFVDELNKKIKFTNEKFERVELKAIAIPIFFLVPYQSNSHLLL